MFLVCFEVSDFSPFTLVNINREVVYKSCIHGGKRRLTGCVCVCVCVCVCGICLLPGFIWKLEFVTFVVNFDSGFYK